MTESEVFLDQNSSLVETIYTAAPEEVRRRHGALLQALDLITSLVEKLRNVGTSRMSFSFYPNVKSGCGVVWNSKFVLFFRDFGTMFLMSYDLRPYSGFRSVFNLPVAYDKWASGVIANPDSSVVYMSYFFGYFLFLNLCLRLYGFPSALMWILYLLVLVFYLVNQIFRACHAFGSACAYAANRLFNVNDRMYGSVPAAASFLTLLAAVSENFGVFVWSAIFSFYVCFDYFERERSVKLNQYLQKKANSICVDTNGRYILFICSIVVSLFPILSSASERVCALSLALYCAFDLVDRDRSVDWSRRVGFILFDLFLRVVTFIRGLRDVDQLPYMSRTIRHLKPSPVVFRSNDYDPADSLSKFRRIRLEVDRYGFCDVKFRGVTWLNGVRYNFPVYCDSKTFCRFLTRVSLWTTVEQRCLKMDHVVFTKRMWDDFKVCVGSRVDIGGAVVFPASLLSFVSIALMYFVADVSVEAKFGYALFALIVPNVPCLLPHEVPYVVLEEIFNWYFGISPTIICEFGSRWHHGIHHLVTVFMHLLVHALPWWLFAVKVFLHVSFNRAVHDLDDNLMKGSPGVIPEKTLESLTVQICTVVDVVRKVCKKDYIGVLLSIGSNFPNIRKQIDLFSCDSLTDGMISFFESIRNELFVDFPDEVSGPAPIVLLDGEKDDHFFRWMLPAHVRHSPLFKKVGAFMFVLAGSQFVGEWLPIDALTRFMEAEAFKEKSNIVKTAVCAVKAVFDAVSRVVASDSLSSFWDMPQDVYFHVHSSKLLYARNVAESKEKIVQDMADARTLLDKRIYKRNDASINKKMIDLEKYIVMKQKFLDGMRVRDQPFPIWLNGPPGTGKTTLIEVLCNMLAVVDKVERFPGDVAKLDIFDKYPLSAACSLEARYLVINDVPDIYTNFDQRNLMPLDVILQKAIDTFPFALPEAAVEMKGRLLNNIRYVFITSNHKQFVFSGETEKLIRRLDYGVLADLSLKTDEKKSYSQVSGYTQAQRNEAMHFTLLNVHSDNKHLVFSDSQVRMRLREMFVYVRNRVLAWNKVVKQTSENFGSESRLCVCGIPVTMHICSPGDSEIIVNESGLRYVQIFSPECSAYFAENAVELNIKSIQGAYYYEAVPASMLVFFALVLTRPDYSVLQAWVSAVLGCTLISFLLVVQTALKWYAYYQGGKTLVSVVGEKVVCSSLFQKILSWKDPFLGYVARAEAKRIALVAWLKDHRFLVGAAITVGSVCGLLAMFNGKTVEELAAPIYEKDVDPKSISFASYRKEMNYPVDKRREWGKEQSDMNVIEFHVKGTAGDDLERMCVSQMLNVTFESLSPAKKSGQVRIFVISPQYFIMNKHYLTKAGNPTKMSFDYNGCTIRVGCEDVLMDDSNELCLVPHSFPIMARGLHNYFPEKEVNVRISCKLPGDQSYSVAIPAAANLMPVALGGYPYTSLMLAHQWEQGMCSTPLLGKISDGAFICGFVSYGSGPWLGCSQVSRQWLNRLTSQVRTPFVEDINVTLLGNAEDFEESISINSESRNISSPYLQVLGTLKTRNDSFRSRIKKTVFYEDIVASDLLSEMYSIPKKDRVVLPGEGYKSPFTHSFAHINLSCDIMPSEARRAVDAFVSHIALDPTLIGARVSFLSMSEAIFGSSDLGIQRVNFKTSCGAPLKEYGIRNKYDLFEKLDDKFFFDPRVMDRVKALDSLFRRNIAVSLFVDGTIKDEVRPTAKTDVAKLRIFSVLCFVYNLWGRMAIMALLTILLNKPELSWCFGGMNAGSSEWHELAIRLKKFSKFFDIDFSTMDFCHGGATIRMFADFMMQLALAFKMRHEDACAIYIYLFSMGIQVFRYKGDVYVKFKGLPSGKIETLMMNSIINVLLLFIAFVRLYPEASDSDFFGALFAAVVGDDNVTGVDSDRYPEIRMTVLKPIYLSMGYVITPASKLGTVLDYVEFGDLTFLRRKFRITPDLGYVAPIATDSIYKALMFEGVELGISPEQRLFDVGVAAQREMFLHGEEKFLQFQSWLADLFGKHNRTIDLLLFSDLVEEYKAKSFRTFAL